jgi:hypothetical protein
LQNSGSTPYFRLFYSSAKVIDLPRFLFAPPYHSNNVGLAFVDNFEDFFILYSSKVIYYFRNYFLSQYDTISETRLTMTVSKKREEEEYSEDVCSKFSGASLITNQLD